MTRKELILGTIRDGVSDLMYYDRKEDEELPRGSIEEAIQKGELTMEDMVDAFREALKERI